MEESKQKRNKLDELLIKLKEIKSNTEDAKNYLENMRNNKKIKCILLALILICYLYVGGVIGGGLSYRSGMSFDLFSCIKRALTTRTGFLGLTMAAFVIIGVTIFVKLQGTNEEDPRGFIRSKAGSYGTSGELEYEKLEKVLHVTSDVEHEKGIILGKVNHAGVEKVVAIPPNSSYNRNIAIAGSQGSMKSWAFARNMIAQCIIRSESMFVMDPKGELYEDTVYQLKRKGYEVMQWNLKDMEFSNSWDILGEIEDGKYIDVLCDVIIKNTLEGEKPDHFYDNIEKDLLKALCLYAYTMYPYGKRTLGAAYELLIQNTPEELDALFESLRQTDPENPAIAPYMLFSKAPNSKGSAVLGLGTRLQIFQTAIVRSITGTKDMDIIAPGKRKCAIFCIVSDQDSTYNVLATTLISMMFVKMVRYADSRPARRCEVDVHFILDEFPNCGEVPDFKKKLATVRSRGIGIDIIYQNLPQLQNRYPDQQWEEILGGCDFRILLACNDTTTSEYNSKLTGTMTIQVESEKKNLNTIRLTDFVPQKSTTKSVGQRMWQLEDEVRRMDQDKLILFVRGEKPIQLTKFPFNEHPSYSEYKVKKTWTYIPGWRLDTKGVDKLTGKVPQKDLTGTPVTEEWLTFVKDLINGKIVDKDGNTDTWQKYITEEEKGMYEEPEKKGFSPAEKNDISSSIDSDSSEICEESLDTIETDLENSPQINMEQPLLDEVKVEPSTKIMRQPTLLVMPRESRAYQTSGQGENTLFEPNKGNEKAEASFDMIEQLENEKKQEECEEPMLSYRTIEKSKRVDPKTLSDKELMKIWTKNQRNQNTSPKTDAKN